MLFSIFRNMESVKAGLGVYCLTWLVMAAGIAFGQMAMHPSPGPHSPIRAKETDDASIHTLTLWDGQWYLEIAQRGYSYDPKHESSVAFFPGYPLVIPYAAKGFEMCMQSQGRYMTAAFPIYIVLGNILSRLPRLCAIAILGLFAAYLAIYTALLAAGFVVV